MKKYLLTVIAGVGLLSATAQRVMSEGTVLYNLSATGTSAEAASVFNGATLTVYFKGVQVLQELKTATLTQSTIYNGKADTAVILKQAGEQKFIINLDSTNWKNYNRRYDGLTYTYSDEEKTIAGFACKKATTKLADGTAITVYYAPGMAPMVKSYDYQFKSLPGLPLEYEVQNGAIKVTYTASRVLFNPVPAFKFDIPKSGYRILDYKSS